MNTAIDIATRFAHSLDNEDYEAAKAQINEQCEYTCRDRVYRGPTEIIESYRFAGDSARHDFDSIEYDSEVFGLEDGKALINFIDHFTYKKQKCTYKCQQVIEVDNEGLILRIELIELPGQMQNLQAFMQRMGISESPIE